MNNVQIVDDYLKKLPGSERSSKHREINFLVAKPFASPNEKLAYDNGSIVFPAPPCLEQMDAVIASPNKKKLASDNASVVVAAPPSIDDKKEENVSVVAAACPPLEEEDEEHDFEYFEPFSLIELFKQVHGDNPDVALYADVEEKAHMCCRTCDDLYPVFCKEPEKHADEAKDLFYCRECGGFADHITADCPNEPKSIVSVCRVCGNLYPCKNNQKHGNNPGDNANYCSRCHDWGHLVQQCSLQLSFREKVPPNCMVWM